MYMNKGGFIRPKHTIVILMMITYLLFCLQLIRYLTNGDILTLFSAVLLLLVANLFFCCTNILKYLFSFLFQIMIFVFLISRPTIEYYRTGTFALFPPAAYRVAFLLILSTLIAFALAGFVSACLIRLPEIPSETKEQLIFRYRLRRISGIIYLISYPVYILTLLEKVMFRLATDYYTYYAEFSTKLPRIFNLVGAFSLYAMVVYLATRPKKKSAFIVLSLYVFTGILQLFIGVRNPLILALLFSLIYFLIRHETDKKERWFGVREKVSLIAGMPLMVAIMGLLNYVRDGKTFSGGPGSLFIDFLYKQGTSFGLLCRGFLYQSFLPASEAKLYSFGIIKDYLEHNNFAQLLLGAHPLPTSGNSLAKAFLTNEYAHNISYVVLGGEYLDGHGLGSTFIMELYTDFGFMGVFIGSFLLALLLVWMRRLCNGRSILLFAIVLFGLTTLFFTPRAGYTEWAALLFSVQFWTAIIIMFAAAYCIKVKGENNYEQI